MLTVHSRKHLTAEYTYVMIMSILRHEARDCVVEHDWWKC